MKQKLPVIIACISFLILGALITAGLFLPERASVRSERLFAKKAASAGTYDKENGASDKEKPERKDGDRKAEDDSKRGEEPYGQTAESPDDTAKGSETSDAAETDEITTNDEPAQDDLPVLPRYSDLLKINPYVSGWLKIDGTVSPLSTHQRARTIFFTGQWTGLMPRRGLYSLQFSGGMTTTTP